MPKGPDPRIETAPLADVPRLMREGAEHFNAARFWHAHEAWESAWHALRKHDPSREAYVHGMILVAAALENAHRGKENGFKRQFAEGLHHMLGKREGNTLVVDARVWEDALVRLYADACRQLDWARWNANGRSTPRVEILDG